MRTIHIANEKKRDANVSLEAKAKATLVEYVMPDGSLKKNIKILKSTTRQSLPALLDKYGDLDAIAKEVIQNDPELDIEKSGMYLKNTRKLYLSKQGKILYGVRFIEISKNPDASEKERKDYSKSTSNVNIEIPVRCTGKMIPKKNIIKMFVFSHKYQIKHVNGLTYDFLYDIAENLDKSHSLMFVGGGSKGTEPLIFYEGGTSYRAFLEGRIKEDKYLLILHLSNLELKELIK